MSDNEKDNREFEFIQEQVIEKRRRKIKKVLFPTITTVGFAVLFGVTAAVTFVIVEPRLDGFLHKEEETITPVCFPTECPTDDNTVTDNESTSDKTQDPTPVIVEQSIDADVEDYLSMNKNIRDVAYVVDRSIVSITSTFSVEDWFGKIVEKKITTSGVIIYNNTQNLLIMVSLDRIQDADSIQMQLSENLSVEAVFRDCVKEINLAIISVAITDIPDIYMNSFKAATLGESYSITVGSPIIALGNPNGYVNSMEIGNITSKGSSVSITDNRLDLFNTDINDNENSDGIIVNLKGEVIGVITRALKQDKNDMLSTAIGISKLKPIIEMLGNQEPHIYFGIISDDLSLDSKEEYGISSGIYVNDVFSKSPAFTAGIQTGDIILKINDMPISNTSDFNNTITAFRTGSKVKVLVLRSNGTKSEEVSLDVILGEKEY